MGKRSYLVCYFKIWIYTYVTTHDQVIQNQTMMILLLYRLVEEVKDQCNVDITNDDVYMATTYDEFVTAIVLKGRGLGGKKEFVYDAVSVL